MIAYWLRQIFKNGARIVAFGSCSENGPKCLLYYIAEKAYGVQKLNFLGNFIPEQFPEAHDTFYCKLRISFHSLQVTFLTGCNVIS